MQQIVDLTWKKQNSNEIFHSLSFTSESPQLAQLGSPETEQSETLQREDKRISHFTTFVFSSLENFEENGNKFGKEWHSLNVLDFCDNRSNTTCPLVYG